MDKKTVTQRMAEIKRALSLSLMECIEIMMVFFIAMPTFPIHSGRSKHINQRQFFSLMREKKARAKYGGKI